MLLALALFAQSVVTPTLPMQAYTTADPIRPAMIGVATQYGRFSAYLTSCGGDLGIEPGQNIEIVGSIGADLGAYAIVPADEDDGVHVCLLRVEQRMAWEPCFTNDEGNCDVAKESDQ